MQATNKILRNRYRIVGQIGQGASGAVYEAYDNQRETNVALKEILIDLERVSTITQQETLKHNFANQAKNLAKIKHDVLPQLRGYFAELDRHYLVMELVDGETAGERVEKNKSAVALSDAADWADQMLDALDYLHALAPPIVHRGVQPKNVKINSRGKAKLLGFDLIENENGKADAVVVNQAAAAEAVNYSALELILRTADLSSQKIFTDEHQKKIQKILKQPLDARSDVYAVGATLYFLLTARLPISAIERAVEVWAEKPDSLPAINQINSDVPQAVSDAVMKALEIDADKRFDSAADMRRALQSAIAHETEDAKRREDEAAREVLLAEEKRLEHERQQVEQERQQIEEERKRQAELIEKQLKEAETQRLDAEKRAAEAEKRLKEKDAKNADGKSKAAKDFSAADQSGKNKSGFAPEKSLFAEPTATDAKKSSMTVPIVVIVVLIAVVAVAGVMIMNKSNAAESKQASANQTTAPGEKPAEPKADQTPQIAAEKSPEANEQPKTALQSSYTETAPAQPNAKPKTTAPAPTPKVVEKPAAPAQPKATPKPKKAVTVDDLIGGN